MTLGFDKQLYILPFDHRDTFQTTMFDWEGTLTAAQTAEIAAAKQAIYDGFKATIAAGVLKDKASIGGGASSVPPSFTTRRRRATRPRAPLRKAGRRNSTLSMARTSPNTSRPSGRPSAGW